MNNSIRVRVKGQNLRLLSQKAIYWEDENSLIVSDLHPCGNTPRHEKVPENSNGVEKSLVKLSQLMREYNVKRIIFTGDLFTGADNDEWKFFCEWRKEHLSVDMEIVMGKNDPLYRSQYERAYVSINAGELTIHPFTFTHRQQEGISFDKYFIYGNIHPVFSVPGLANQDVSLPCFHFGRMQAILPSFGQFSKGKEVRRKQGDQVYLVLDNTVVEVN